MFSVGFVNQLFKPASNSVKMVDLVKFPNRTLIQPFAFKRVGQCSTILSFKSTEIGFSQ